MKKIYRRLKKLKCRIKFENVFLENYSADFQYKNMLRISLTVAFNFTLGVFI
jgi:hypothetical protein